MLFYRRLSPRASIPELAARALAAKKSEAGPAAPIANGHADALMNGSAPIMLLCLLMLSSFCHPLEAAVTSVNCLSSYCAIIAPEDSPFQAMRTSFLARDG